MLLAPAATGGAEDQRLRTLLGGSRGALALLAEVGRGRLVLLASSSPLDNGLLGCDDNAAFALDLAGPAGSPDPFRLVRPPENELWRAEVGKGSRFLFTLPRQQQPTR